MDSCSIAFCTDSVKGTLIFFFIFWLEPNRLSVVPLYTQSKVIEVAKFVGRLLVAEQTHEEKEAADHMQVDEQQHKVESATGGRFLVFA